MGGGRWAWKCERQARQGLLGARSPGAALAGDLAASTVWAHSMDK